MRSTLRKILVGSLLATYGVVGLLGQGLHWLSAVDHHHHGIADGHCHSHGKGHAHAHSHSHEQGEHHHHHHGDELAACETADVGDGLLVRNAAGLAECGECDICAFLSQIKSEWPQVAAIEIWQFVISPIPSAEQRTYASVVLGPHSPRGPPSLKA